MTTPLPFGATLAFAEQTLSAVLIDHLAERGTAPETWYALQLLGLRGPGLARDELTEALERSRTLDGGKVRALLARLTAEGLITGDAVLDLTPAGRAEYESLRAYVTEPTKRLLSEFDPEDVATTLRTLQAITARAAG